MSKIDIASKVKTKKQTESSNISIALKKNKK